MSAKEKSTSRTVIGPTIVIRGQLKSDEDLVVRGRIDAQITSTRSLEIERSGIVKANVSVESARISGVVVGNVTAGSRVEIASDGRVVGDLLAPRIVINDGAAFKGRIDMQTFDEVRPVLPASEEVEERPAPWAEGPPAEPEAEELERPAASLDEGGPAYALGAAPLGGEAVKEDSAPRGRRRRG